MSTKMISEKRPISTDVPGEGKCPVTGPAARPGEVDSVTVVHGSRHKLTDRLCRKPSRTRRCDCELPAQNAIELRRRDVCTPFRDLSSI